MGDAIRVTINCVIEGFEVKVPLDGETDHTRIAESRTIGKGVEAS